MRLGSAFDPVVPEPQPIVSVDIHVIEEAIADLREILASTDRTMAQLAQTQARIGQALVDLAAPRVRHVHRDAQGDIDRIVEEPEHG